MNVTLRDVHESDLATFYRHQVDPVACRMAAFTPRDETAFMAHWKERILGDPAVSKKTILFEGNIAGNVVCFGRSGEREVGYWIAREYWGRGIATTALLLFLASTNERPLFAVVAKHNIASIRVLEKCGFTLDRRISRPEGERGPSVDEVILKLTRQPPPRLTRERAC